MSRKRWTSPEVAEDGGAILKFFRERYDLTRSDIAQKLGISVDEYDDLESGRGGQVSLEMYAVLYDLAVEQGAQFKWPRPSATEEEPDRTEYKESKRCKHFNGHAVNLACKAGVFYNNFPKHKMPCWDSPEGCGSLCSKRALPTAEEIAERKRQSQECMRRADVARAAIIAQVGTAKGVEGSVPCPFCQGGEIGYFIPDDEDDDDPLHQAVHARCSNRCVDFAEY